MCSSQWLISIGLMLSVSHGDKTMMFPQTLPNYDGLYLTDYEVITEYEGTDGTLETVEHVSTIQTLWRLLNYTENIISPDIWRLKNLRSLYLPSSSLYGVIPKSIGLLKNLTQLNLRDNSLYGSIPVEIGYLTSLEVLDLGSNYLRGEIPGELGGLGSLSFLNLEKNSFFGEIPKELYQLHQLYLFSMADNLLSGTISSEIGNLKNLGVLQLGTNRLSGEIPKEIGKLDSLWSMDMQQNDLDGEIPREIGNLKNLYYLNLGENRLSGNIPKEIGKLQGLTTLDLQQNDLTGEIPREIGNCTQLSYLKLQVNRLSGKIPVEFWNMVNLEFIILSNNGFEGGFPEELGNLTKLQILYAAFNNLTGELPESFSSLRHLTWVYLSHNSFSGPLPSGVGQLTQLEGFDVYTNNFSGDIPWPAFSQLPKLYLLYLANNEFTGEIPIDIANMTAMQYVYLNNNRLHGVIPDEIGMLQKLISFAVSNNNIDKIPWENITALSILTDLQIAKNNIQGEIPGELISRLYQLERLDVSSNGFTGLLPYELASMNNLKKLDVSNCNFSGSVPYMYLKEAYSGSGLTYLDLSNNQLTGMDFILPVSSYISHLDFSGNPWFCGKRLSQHLSSPLLKVRSDYSGIVKNIDNTLCSSSSLSFAGRRLVDLGVFSTSIPEIPFNVSANNVNSTSIEITWASDEPLVALPPMFPEPHCWSCEDRLTVLPSWLNSTKSFFVDVETNLTRFLDATGAGYPYLFQIKYRHMFSEKKVCCWNDYSNTAVLTDLIPFETYDISVSGTHVSFGKSEIELDWWTTKSIYDGSTDWFPSAFSLSVLATTDEDKPSSAPDKISVFSSAEDELVLNWAAPRIKNGEITSYTVKRNGILGLTSTVSSSLIVSGLSSNTSYTFQISASTVKGQGPFSKPIVSTTLASCSAGFFRDSGELSCTVCPLNFYSTLSDTWCMKCPDEKPFTKLNGTSSLLGCVPGPGWYVEDDGTVNQCDGGLGSEGVRCDKIGTTVESIRLLESYWRYSPRSKTILRCPKRSFCIGGNGATSRRLLEGDIYCAPNHQGIKCMDCVENYTMRSDGCIAIADNLASDTWRFGVLVFFLVMVAFVPSIYLWWGVYFSVNASAVVEAMPKRNSKTRECSAKVFGCINAAKFRYSAFVERHSTTRFLLEYFGGIKSKFRIIFGFYQVLFIVTTELENPRASSAGLNKLLEIYSGRFLDMFSIGAFYDTNYYDKVFLVSLYPIGVVLLAGMVRFICRFKYRAAAELGRALFIRVTIVIAFLVFPSVSSLLVAVFMWSSYETKYLESPIVYALGVDETIDFSTTESVGMRIYSGLMLALYVIGTIAMYYAGARMYTHASNNNKMSKELHHALKILVEPYNPSFSWYECVELVRKLLLTSGVVLLNWADQELTIPVFLFVSSLFLFIVAKMRPYVSKYDQTFAEISLFFTCWVPLAAISGNQSLRITAVLVGCLEFTALVVVRYLEYSNGPNHLMKKFPSSTDPRPQVATELSDPESFRMDDLSKNSMVQA